MSMRPYFFWDHDITEKEIKRILAGKDTAKKAWVVARILKYALWKDIWKYLTVSMIVEILPMLRMDSKEKELWNYAVKRWRREL